MNWTAYSDNSVPTALNVCGKLHSYSTVQLSVTGHSHIS